MDERDRAHLVATYSYDPNTGRILHKRCDRIVGSLNEFGYLGMYVALPSRKRLLKCHCVAWFLYHGTWPHLEVDHADGDKANNRIDNLRLATGGQNRANTKKYKGYGSKPTKSKYKGVSWHKRDKYWFSYIRVDKKLIQLGKFSTELDAARAYNEAALTYFGSFAVLNDLP